MQTVVYPPVNPAPATAEQVCGGCRFFKPSRNEPESGHRYGHCDHQIKMAREASALYPQIHLYDDTSRCTIVSSLSGARVFESKEPEREKA
jgi:hypothetical protein